MSTIKISQVAFTFSYGSHFRSAPFGIITSSESEYCEEHKCFHCEEILIHYFSLN